MIKIVFFSCSSKHQWKTFDAAVGDFTILAYRMDKVEFTQPYIESGLTMIVPEKAEQLACLFMKPLTWQMWTATGGVLVYTILVVWFLERPSNPEFSGPFKNQIGTATWFTFTSLFFSQSKLVPIQINISTSLFVHLHLRVRIFLI